MKILFTGGGSGGHFYPIIAIAEEIHRLAAERKLLEPDLFFMSDAPYSESLLFSNRIIYLYTPAGKLRRYFSALNVIDIFKTIIGLVSTFFTILRVYPDIIFSKGGYASFPAVFSARLLKIPLMIHESDSVPGRVNAWSSKFATRIAVSYAESAAFFPKDKVAYTGNPIRRAVKNPLRHGAHEFLELDEHIPVLLILGGSLGSEFLNDILLDALPQLLTKYQIIHQTGRRNFVSVRETSAVVLAASEYRARYKMFDYLNDLAISMAAGVADLVISRAGSAIFEIAAWGVPSIMVPLDSSSADHQRKNAFHYAKSGAAVLLEHENLTPHILISEIDHIMEDSDRRRKMSERAKAFAKPDAAKVIAEELLGIALSHES